MEKNPSRRVWFSYAHETLSGCSSLHGSVRLEVFWNPLSDRRVGEFGRIWNLKIRCFCPRSRIIITESFYFLCDLDWMIIVHLDHMIRNIEESTGTASHQNGGNLALSYRFLARSKKGVIGSFSRLITCCMNSSRSMKLVAEVSSSIKNRCAADLQTFDYPGRLRSTSTGVHGREAGRILLIGKIIDKHGNIYISYGSSIF